MKIISNKIINKNFIKKNEIMILKELDHPNILKIYEFF